MTIQIDITKQLQDRLRQVAERLDLSPSDLVADALENGHSLEWQEQFLRKVADGVEAAEAGDFVSDEDLERIRNRYRPA